MAALNLSTQRFGRLTVTARAPDGTMPGGRRYVRWFAACDCGRKTTAATTHLRSKSTISCGCHRRENSIAPFIKHGDSNRKGKTAEYRAWIAMKNRCHNKKQDRYKDYGGRGITVCERWRNSFSDFLADMGRKPSASHSLDRYPDNDGNYEPGNCRWATPAEQNANQRRRARIDQFTDDELVAELKRRGNPLRVQQHHGRAAV